MRILRCFISRNPAPLSLLGQLEYERCEKRVRTAAEEAYTMSRSLYSSEVNQRLLEMQRSRSASP